MGRKFLFCYAVFAQVGVTIFKSVYIIWANGLKNRLSEVSI